MNRNTIIKFAERVLNIYPEEPEDYETYNAKLEISEVDSHKLYQSEKNWFLPKHGDAITVFDDKNNVCYELTAVKDSQGRLQKVMVSKYYDFDGGKGNVGNILDHNYILSNEVDENGQQFVLNSEGNIEFGVISEETGLSPAPMLLSEGIITNNETKDGYGLLHIEARHGEQIRRAGFNSVIEFIEDVAKNYEIIREGKMRDGKQTYMLQLTDRHNNTLMVELSGDGSYWNINTAGIFKISYGANRNVVYNRHATAKQSAEIVEASLSGEQSGTTPSTSMSAPTQTSNDVSNDKGTTKTQTGNEKEQNNATNESLGENNHFDGEVTVEVSTDKDGITTCVFNQYRKTRNGRIARVTFGGATAVSDDFILDVDGDFEEMLASTKKEIRVKSIRSKDGKYFADVRIDGIDFYSVPMKPESAERLIQQVKSATNAEKQTTEQQDSKPKAEPKYSAALASAYTRQRWTAESDIKEMNQRLKTLQEAFYYPDESQEGKEMLPQFDEFRKAKAEAKGKYGSADKVPQEVVDELKQRFSKHLQIENDMRDEIYELKDAIEAAEAKLSEKQKQELEREKFEHRRTAFNGNLAHREPMQAARIERALNKKININGDVKTIGEFIEEWANSGNLTVSTKEYKPDIPKSKWNKMSQEKQDEWERTHDKTTTEYLVNGYALGKTAYSYAKWLQQEKAKAGNGANKQHKAEGRDANVGDVLPDDAAMRDALIERLEGAGIEVQDGEEAQAVLDAAKDSESAKAKKRALETASVTSSEAHQPTVVSSADGAKILNNLDNLPTILEENTQPKEWQ